MNDKLLELFALLRAQPEVEGAAAEPAPADWPHADGLTFARADQLAQGRARPTAQEQAHLASCRRCAGLLGAFRRQLAELRGQRWRRRLRAALRVLGFALLPPVVNWLIACRLASPTASSLNWWHQAQQHFFWLGLAVALLLCLLAPLFERLGWMGRLPLWLPLALLGLLGVSSGFWLFAQHEQARVAGELDAVFLGRRWVEYEPPAQDPTTEEIERDLLRLRREEGGGPGFDGLVTFSARGTRGEIPRVARRCGFRAVIMGLAVDPKDPARLDEQIDAAVAARGHVDGYCVGYNPPTTLDLGTLAGWMNQLRRATGRPVTTTAPLAAYLGEHGAALRDVGDWYCPDCGPPSRLAATPRGMVRQALRGARLAAGLPRDKPVLLRGVGCPSGGGPGLSEQAQEDFFRAVCRELYLAPGVHASVCSAYDAPHTLPGHEGLFTASGRAKPAAEVARDGFPVQSRR